MIYTKKILPVLLVVVVLALFGAAYVRSQQMQADVTPSPSTPQPPVADTPVAIPTPPQPAVEASASVSVTPSAPSTPPAPTVPKKTPSPAPRVTVHHVTIKNYTFVPASLEIKVGDTVVWTNEDEASHTIALSDRSFESALIRTGESFSRTFTAAGTVPYECGPHPYMKASLKVTQ